MELKREAEVEVKESFRLDVINYPIRSHHTLEPTG